jgi:peptide/nickel transport system ATP-binding protein/oligopeptide transport system ATP-binding protein
MLLELRGLAKTFPARDGKGTVHAVNGVNLAVAAGTTLGIVGESGCGKSTLARLLLRLIEPDGGDVLFEGESILAMDRHRLRALRRHLQIVHQDPFSSLNPRLSVQNIIAEPLEIHGVGTKQSRRARVSELLVLVGLDPDAANKYPHEFSGGQRQRICIARAIALEPKLLILDEPVSALDVSIQSQVLNLLMDLKQRLGLTYVFISHDLSVVNHISDDVAVMYLGRVVEQGPAEAVLQSPLHPYTQALVSAVPDIAMEVRKQRIILSGDPPSPEHIPPGCAFHPRCFRATPDCASRPQSLRTFGGRQLACHRAGE